MPDTSLHENLEIYTCDALAQYDFTKAPHHVALIMDGNRRWAKEHGLSTYLGHVGGSHVLIEIVKAAKDLGIKVVTAYSFSTENWKRPQQEIDDVFAIFEQFLEEQCPFMKDKGVRFHWIGDISSLPHTLQEKLLQTQKATVLGNTLDLILAVNYGSRDEMRRALVRICEEYRQGRLNKEDLTEETMSRYLDPSPSKEVDLLIRTGGERRLSNFLLWQSHYAEIYFSDRQWPAFSPRDFLDAVINFQKRQRRKGA